MGRAVQHSVCTLPELSFCILYISIFLHFLHFLHFGNDMADVCGIIADIKREGEGEYIIPTCTIFGLDKEEEGQLESHGLKVSDSNPRMDGVEVTGSSPFKVMRILCKHFGWETDGKSMQFAAPGDRTTSMWQLTKKILLLLLLLLLQQQQLLLLLLLLVLVPPQQILLQL